MDKNKDSFRLTDMQLFIGDTRLPLLTVPASELCLAWFASLMFTSQKNGVRGKVIGLACSGNPYLCPVQAIIRRVLYLCLHMAPPTTPLARVFHTPTRSPHPTSPHVFVSQSRHWARTLASFLLKSWLGACMPLAQQPSSWPKSTRTSSASLAAGAQTKCFSTYTSKPTSS
jgi:hypothetical protein